MTAADPPHLSDDLPVVLVVDDEVRSQEAMRRTLDEEFQVLAAGDADAARALLERHRVAVILCDQRMPGQSGVDFLKQVRVQWPEVVRVVISGYADSEDIIAGVNEAGIWQYVLKPWVPEHLLATVRSAVEASTLRQGLQRVELDLRAGAPALKARLGDKLRQARHVFDFDRIVRAPDSPLGDVCTMAERVARHDLSVMILGESGTGKELLARAIHYASPRLGKAFVVENCAAIPDTLLESELFGHKRGAFTGAVDDHVGLVQRADGGTLFLDEIGETSPLFQVKLLRVLQEGEVRPVGAARAVPVDLRIIAATHRQLEDDVRAGRFREDLYYRLAGVTLQVPPLRQRPCDIVPIAERLLVDVCRELGLPAAHFEDDARRVLMGYAWPGNIRELRNEIGRALALGEGASIRASDFSPKLLQGQAGTGPHTGERALPPGAATGSLQDRLDAIEAMLLREVMLRHRWNKTRAAAELGLSRVGLRGKLIRFGLEVKAAPSQEPH
ncbi:MAG: sigma-54 dependent transcriptional regulator [Aquabacterium sp.]|nr:sigma-54 dependent transcriptional regulator [Aquabacterium sp.]